MSVIVIIFMIVATIFALALLGYVMVDVILEIRNKEESKEQPVVVVAPPVVEEVLPEPEPEPEPEPDLEPEPEPEPEPEIIVSEPVVIPEDFPEPEPLKVGIEVIDVAWPESMAKNKIYKYDPDGESLVRGDTVLVPTFDKHRHGNILRTATVINGNYHIESLPEGRTLKKIVRKIN